MLVDKFSALMVSFEYGGGDGNVRSQTQVYQRLVADVTRRLTALKHLKLEKQVLARTELSQIQPLLLYKYLSTITIFKTKSILSNKIP